MPPMCIVGNSLGATRGSSLHADDACMMLHTNNERKLLHTAERVSGALTTAQPNAQLTT